MELENNDRSSGIVQKCIEDDMDPSLPLGIAGKDVILSRLRSSVMTTVAYGTR
jgi:hypothetical protein